MNTIKSWGRGPRPEEAQSPDSHKPSNSSHHTSRTKKLLSCMGYAVGPHMFPSEDSSNLSDQAILIPTEKAVTPWQCG